MKFYGRTKQIEKIRGYKKLTIQNNSKILVITGRRRIGKTRLIIEATKQEKRLYFFVARKRIDELLNEWSIMIKKELGNIFLGNLSNLDDLLQVLFQFSQQNPLTVIFDEFQNFNYSNKEAYSVFQKQFDLNKENSSLLIIFSGSSYSLMEKIFKGNKEPLFGRASDIMKLSYISLKAQTEFLSDKSLKTSFDKIFLFSVFDGVPKYWEAIDEVKGKSFKVRLQKILTESDWIWEEGEMLLKEEFGKEYATYYSIMSAISKGRRLLNEIEQFSGVPDATIYLHRLENIYNLIERRYPVTEVNRKKSRKSRWYIKDNFFRYWFAFIEPRKYLKEIGQSSLAAKLIIEELMKYSGKLFEEMIIRKIIEENPLDIQFTRLGNYWDRKGKVEIDVVLINDLGKSAYFIETKLNKKKITKKIVSNLIDNSKKIKQLEDYSKSYYLVYPEKNDFVFKSIKEDNANT